MSDPVSPSSSASSLLSTADSAADTQPSSSCSSLSTSSTASPEPEAANSVVSPFPIDEEARLAALERYRLLDTPYEKCYDEVSDLARQVCDTPIGAVTLVARDRIWFKSIHGLPYGQIPRHNSFCAHCIMSSLEPLVVEDLAIDQRFRNEATVCAMQGPRLRFYCGFPLLTNDGYPLGTLCVLDTKPRKLSQLQLHTMQVLTNQVSHQIELRVKNRILNETIHSLELTTALLERQKQVAEESMKIAEAANKAKTVFFSSLSHELRTPIHTILGNVNLVKDNMKQDPAQQAAPLPARYEESCDCLDAIQNGAQHLLTLVNDLLEFSKVDVGAVKLESIAFPLVSTIEQAIELSLSAVSVTEKEIDFSYSIDQRLQGSIQTTDSSLFYGDPTRIRQMIVNLLSNAFKFTPSGAIELRVSLLDSIVPANLDNGSESAKWISIECQDSGIGMKDSEWEQLIQPFSQANASISRQFGGSGLGLAFVAKLIRLMGGNLTFRSQIGQGSTFILTLPLKQTQPSVLTAQVLQSAIESKLKTSAAVFVYDFNEKRGRFLESIIKTKCSETVLCLNASSFRDALHSFASRSGRSIVLAFANNRAQSQAIVQELDQAQYTGSVFLVHGFAIRSFSPVSTLSNEESTELLAVRSNIAPKHIGGKWAKLGSAMDKPLPQSSSYRLVILQQPLIHAKLFKRLDDALLPLASPVQAASQVQLTPSGSVAINSSAQRLNVKPKTAVVAPGAVKTAKAAASSTSAASSATKKLNPLNSRKMPPLNRKHSADLVIGQSTPASCKPSSRAVLGQNRTHMEPEADSIGIASAQPLPPVLAPGMKKPGSLVSAAIFNDMCSTPNSQSASELIERDYSLTASRSAYSVDSPLHSDCNTPEPMQDRTIHSPSSISSSNSSSTEQTPESDTVSLSRSLSHRRSVDLTESHSSVRPVMDSALNRLQSLEKAAAVANGPRFILADDDPTSLKLLCRMLERCGYSSSSLHPTSTGSECLDAFYSLVNKGFNADIIITDYNMPHYKGNEVKQQIDSYCLQHQLTPPTIILFSASVWEKDMHEVFDWILTKPAGVEGLKDMIDRCLQSRVANQNQNQQAGLINAPVVGAEIPPVTH